MPRCHMSRHVGIAFLKKRFYHHTLIINQGAGMMRVRIQEVSVYIWKDVGFKKRGPDKNNAPD